MRCEDETVDWVECASDFTWLMRLAGELNALKKFHHLFGVAVVRN
jgi:hypothetical protein